MENNKNSENGFLEVGCNSKMNIRDIYSELFHCRDFELEHLWQRSVFLATFITLILTAYGTFAGSNIDKMLDSTFKYYDYYHAVCFALCGIGIVFCQLWIAMSKGSKMWYEKYEEAIRWFYSNCDNNDTKKKLFDETVFLEKNFTKDMPYFGNLSDLDLNNSFFSTKAGKYSVSKVNTFIGIFLCFVLMTMATLHFSTLFQCEKYINLIISAMSIMTHTFIISKIVKSFTKSRM